MLINGTMTSEKITGTRKIIKEWLGIFKHNTLSLENENNNKTLRTRY